jgi:general secretion pathway protein N
VILKAIGMRAVYASDRMCRVAILATLITTWSMLLHAEGQSSHQLHSTLKLDALSATRERPLFSPTRRRVTPPPAAAIQPAVVAPDVRQLMASKEPQLTLTGIIVGPDGTIVLLRDRSTSEFVAVRPGEAVGRWRVSVDSIYAVELRDGERAFKLEMFAEP